jgi:hypothetical protein
MDINSGVIMGEQQGVFDRELSAGTVAKLLWNDGFTEAQIKAFFKWRSLNKAVMKEFEKRFLKEARSGKTRIGAKDIWEDMRKDTGLEKFGTPYNLDNRQTALCAAVISYKWPEYSELIERRKKKGAA